MRKATKLRGVAMNQIYGTKDVAKACDVTTTTVRNWNRTGKLNAERTPSGVRLFRKSDVDRLATKLARKKTSAAQTQEAK